MSMFIGELPMHLAVSVRTAFSKTMAGNGGGEYGRKSAPKDSCFLRLEFVTLGLLMFIW